jgi:hypothetical protein
LTRSLLLALGVRTEFWFAAAPDPSEFGRNIATDGPRTVVSRLSGSGNYDEVLRHVASGDKPWVTLAPALAQGTDAAEGLSTALAEALPRNVEGALAVLDPARRTISPARVCGVPFMEGTSIDIGSYVAEAKTAVSADRLERLRAARSACLAALHS